MQLRVARHTNQLSKLTDFYCNILGFELLGQFDEHEGYNGVFLGFKDHAWHLEFTQDNGLATHHFDPDDLLVIYPSSQAEFDAIKQHIKRHKIAIHRAKNPYWNRNGLLIKDPDGAGIVISHMRIKSAETQKENIKQESSD